MEWSVIFTYFGYMLLTASVSGQDPEVDTHLGRIRGSHLQGSQGRSYDAFLGVPFGASAEGRLRFAKPEEPEAWEGVLDTQEFSIHCTQIIGQLYPLIGLGGEDGEDCLYLNVWVPGESRPGHNLPVMVYFAGGAFQIMTGEMYPGQELALIADAIVVVPNYRVGTLGWLGTNDAAGRGNSGLWDFTHSLRWVQRNIANFGGDPSKVTIFGQSAGGGGVGHCMLSEVTRGMFIRGIMQSGGMTSMIVRGEEVREAAVAVGDYFGCPTEDSQAMLDCLRLERAEDIDLWGLIAPIMAGVPPAWSPNIDGEFLTAHPCDLLRGGAAAQYDFLAGRTFHDGAVAITGNMLGTNDSTDVGRTQNSTDEFLLNALSNYPDPEVAMAFVKQQYPDLNSNSARTRNLALAMMITDRGFGLSSHIESEWHAGSSGSRGQTFQYEYQYRMSFFQYPEWVNASHLDDLYSTFGEPFMHFFRETYLDGSWSDDDYRSFHNMATYWRNFVHNGDPSVGNPMPAVWPQYNNNTRQFARITAYLSPSSIETEHTEYLRRYNFWRHERDPQPESVDDIWRFGKYASDPDSISLQDAYDVLEHLIKELGIPDILYKDAEVQLKKKLEESYYRVQQRRDERRRARERSQ